jgi:solute carrier family 35 protein C2
VATIFISSLVFGDILTIINIIGLCITLFGIGLYNWLKMKALSLKSQKDVREQDIIEDGHESDQEEEDHYEMSRSGSHHLYSMVAESTPILLVDGGLTNNYRDSEDSDRRHNQYELH